MIKYLRIPFKIRGCDWDGCDCWGLVRLWYQHKLGIILPDESDGYSNIKDSDEVGEVVRRNMPEWDRIEQPKKNAVILFRPGITWHIGILLDESRMLHCSSGKGTTIERFMSPRWRTKIEGFYSYAG